MQGGQIAVEYMSLMAIGFVMLLFFLIIAGDQLEDLNKDSMQIEANDVAFMVQSEILSAATVEDGYERNFTIPDKIGHYDYALSVLAGQSLTVLTLDVEKVHIALAIPNVTGQLVIGKNRIFRQNATVYLNQIP